MLPLKGLLDAALKLAPPPRDDVRDEGRGVKFRKENGHANEEVEAYDLLLFSPPLQREESTSMDTQRFTIPPSSSSSCTCRPPRGGAQLCASIDTMLRRGLLLHIYLHKILPKKRKNTSSATNFPRSHSRSSKAFHSLQQKKENPRKQRIHIYLYSWHPRKPII
jgi:hypothetical protein